MLLPLTSSLALITLPHSVLLLLPTLNDLHGIVYSWHVRAARPLCGVPYARQAAS